MARENGCQDCWRVYDNEPQQQAVRRILQKNIKVEELAENLQNEILALPFMSPS